jgi:hypothetical protein
LPRLAVLSFGFCGIAMVEIEVAVGVVATVLDFLLCNVGRLVFTSLRTDGALA